jgi:hypothetical protein
LLFFVLASAVLALSGAAGMLANVPVPGFGQHKKSSQSSQPAVLNEDFVQYSIPMTQDNQLLCDHAVKQPSRGTRSHA